MIVAALPLMLLGPVGWYAAFAFCMKAAHHER